MCLLLIIASVACANDPAYDDPTSIWYTSRKGEVDKVKALIDNDSALLDAEDKWRRTPLLYSAKAGHHEVVRYLLSQGSKSANLTDVYGYAPVHWAAMYNKVRALEAFAEHNVDLDVRDEQDRTPLMCAMGNMFSNSPKHEETVRFLISKGVDVNATDKNGFSALHWGATLTGKQKSVAELLKLSKDLNLNVTDKEGGTALHKAAGFEERILPSSWSNMAPIHT